MDVSLNGKKVHFKLMTTVILEILVKGKDGSHFSLMGNVTQNKKKNGKIDKDKGKKFYLLETILHMVEK